MPFPSRRKPSTFSVRFIPKVQAAALKRTMRSLTPDGRGERALCGMEPILVTQRLCTPYGVYFHRSLRSPGLPFESTPSPPSSQRLPAASTQGAAACRALGAFENAGTPGAP